MYTHAFRLPRPIGRPFRPMRLPVAAGNGAKAPIALRPYDSERDLEACLSIWRQASRSGHPFLSAADLAADEHVVRDVYMPAARITVAERGGEPVGFIALIDNFIGALFVAPHVQGLGAGTRLMDTALSRQGELIVEVYAANRHARCFYQARGFIERLCWLQDDQGRRLPVIQMIRPAPRSAHDRGAV